MSRIIFRDMSLVEDGVIINAKSKESLKISFSEMNKIYITVNVVSAMYVLLYIVASTALMLTSILVLGLSIFQLLPLLLITLGAIKINNFKRYGMRICFKKGDILELQVPLELKYKAIDFVNKIRKELFILSMND